NQLADRAAAATPMLLDALKDEVAKIYPLELEPGVAYVRALASIGPPALSSLTGALDDPDAIMRSRIIDTLSEMGSKRGFGVHRQEILPLVLRGLRDSEAEVRHHAANAVSMMRTTSQDVIAELIKCLVDKDRSVRNAASEALRSCSVT